MSSEQLTCRIAFQKVIEKRQKNKYASKDTSRHIIKLTNLEAWAETYTSVVSGNETGSILNQEESLEHTTQEEVEISLQNSTKSTTQTALEKEGGRKKPKSKKSQNVQKYPIGKQARKNLNQEEHEERDEQLQCKFELKIFINKFKNIYKSEGNFEDKFIQYFQI